MPQLLRTRPLPLQVLLAVVVPAAFGAVCGYLLGVDKTAYLVLSLLAILGGYAAGQEHQGAFKGAVRGVIGGSLFGVLILLVNDATGKHPKATLPDPKIALVGITVGAGVLLGALGGARRARTPESEASKFHFDIRRLDRSELVGFAGSAVLLGSLWLPWFSTSCDTHGMPAGCNPHSTLHKLHGTFNAFQTFSTLQWLLIAACAAPFVLAYIVARGHDLNWRPGEVTMIVGMLAFTLVLLNGVILGRPGESPHNVDIALEPGYAVGLVGGALIAFGGFVRQSMSIRSRKPPGVM